MPAVNLKNLVGKLNDPCRRALEAAAGLCLSRTNYNVEIEHWLLKLLDAPNSDLAAIFREFDVDPSRVTMDLMKVIDGFKTGNSRPPSLSPNVVDLVREGWLIASIDFSESATRSGQLLLALLTNDALARLALTMSREFNKISPEALAKDLRQVTADTDEAAASQPAAIGGAAASGRPAGPTKTPSLDQFTNDLTGAAKAGRIDPVLGRDTEIRQIIDILMRRRQNNPILTGEAGVGKTAVAEGFALRIAAGDVPEPLKAVSLRALDLGLLQAGAGVKGEFENRLKSVIDEVKASPTPIILFIDEAHTLIGAGGAAGQGDAANLLKPALARGELRTIAATTWAEYKKYFEKDAALARRFQVVKVDEPDEETAIDMMRGLVDTLQRHHNVRILNDAVVDAVRLSKRYISGRQLPDKAVSLLDTTCARISISQATIPPAVEDAQRRISQLEVAIDILERESASGTDHEEELNELIARKNSVEQELAALQERWNTERELVEQIRELRGRLEDDPGRTPRQLATGVDVPTPAAAPARNKELTETDGSTATADRADAPPPAALTPEQRQQLRSELEAALDRLTELQGQHPLVHVCVDGQAVAATVAAWTGIPLGRMVSDEVHTVLNLKPLMEEAIVGQSHALEAIAQRIRTSRAQLSDPRTPIGVFLLVGTSGVGKTETAITLANLLYGGEQNMTVINMSEFKEEHKVSLLMGSPPGYVGYGEGGVLTEAVRRKPYSVVLLDEMEKAHPGVQDIFYQVFDKGTMKDGEGRDIDFKNTVILMTTNAGSDLIKSITADPETAPDPESFTKAIFPELLKTFKPAFLGRLSLVPYYPLSDDVLRSIVQLKLDKIGSRIAENHKAKFTYSPDLVDQIAQRCTEVDTGARNIDHILTGTLLPELSAEFLSRMADGLAVGSVRISVNSGGFEYEIS